MSESVVGRQPELVSVETFIARAQEAPCACFLEGEAGIGKTRIWREGIERANLLGLRVLSAHPGGSDVRLAFSGLTDLLDDEACAALLPALPAPQRRALEVALLLEDPVGEPLDERAVAAAFLGCLRLLSDTGSVLVAIDDLQWLDATSASVLEFVCRRLQTEPVGVLATVRTAADEAPLDGLARAFGPDRLDRMQLGPLTVAAIYELVKSHLGIELARPVLLSVHELSGGNPFYALELVRGLPDGGRSLPLGEPLPVPATLRELVRGRLALLPRSAGTTLRLAAGLARPTLPTLVQAVGSPARAERDLAAAERAGVVELVGDRVRFTHPLLASIHFAAVPLRARRAAHRTLAGVAEDGEERARHLALATVGHDADVATTLAHVAAQARARGAIATAADLAEEAVRLTPLDVADELHRRVVVAAEWRYAAGNTARAIELLEEALAFNSSGEQRAELLWSLGKVAHEGKDVRVALAYFHRALLESSVDEGLRARILESMTFPAAKHEGRPAARRYVHEAITLSERLGDRRTLALALAQLAAFEERPRQQQLFERAIALEAELGGLGLDYGPTAQYAVSLIESGEYAEARELLERLCRRGRASGDAAVHQPLIELSGLEFEVGNWDRAEALAREAYDIAIQTGREAAEPKGLFMLAHVEAGQGKIDAARRHGEAALVLTDGRGWSSGGPRGALGLLELSLENFAAAYEVLIPCVERYRAIGVPVIGQTFDAAEALAGTGAVQEGSALLARCDEAPELMRVPWARSAAGRARGLLAAAAGDLVVAECALRDAVAASEPAGNPLEHARNLLALGGVQRRARKKQAARRTLDDALRLFEQLGASVWAARAQRELGRIGGRSTPRDELSATEAEIVRLVVAGHSNKEVAAALHLSPKTVEWNLSKIYGRLGVHSRTELAAAQKRSD
jgi:DNA-binding CsgD family transcriptional regulator